MSDEINVIGVDGTDLKVGDEVRVVVQTTGNEGDPVAYIDGTITIIHTDEDADVEPPSFGETVRVTIADARENQIHAVYQGEADE